MNESSAQKISSGYTLVENAQALAEVTEKLRSTNRVGIDTEADSLHHYFEKVCLIQISFLGTNYIIDPLAKFSLSDFFEVLSKKELIFQGADYDLRILKKSFGFLTHAPVFDTMIAAQVLGYEKIGLAAIAEKFFGVVMSKSSQKADWSKRPLTQQMLHYASDDTKYLEAIADFQAEELQKLGRLAWHQECCERVVKNSSLQDKNEDKEPWRVKGSSKMPPEELVFLQELWKWRDEEARKRDRPPFYIMMNEDLVEFASWQAHNRKAPLREGPPWLNRITGEPLARLMQAIETAKKIHPADWPLPPKKIPWPAKLPHQGKLDQLIASCKKKAEELKIDSPFLASRSTLTAVIQNEAETIEKVMETSGMMRWQAELLLPAIRSALLGDSRL